MFWWKRHRQTTLILLLLLILIIPVILPLLRHGFFQSDDGEWMIIRFSAFHQAFRDGQFPVRWLGRLNQEYGYPVANFLYPGFMYLAEIPKVIGFSFVSSVKIIIGFSLIFSAIFSYLWLNKLFSKLSSLAGAIFYLYAPYHLWDVYKRGSVGEVLALAVVPFILWMIEKKNWFLYSCGIGLLILSHNTLAILFLPIIIVYGLLKKLNTKHLILNTLLGLGLAAFFWLPAIYDLQYTRFFQTQVSQWQNYFVGFPLIGWGTIIVFFATAIFCLLDTYHKSRTSWFFLVTGIITTFFSLSISKFIWQILPVSFIQFPFRLLSVTIICGAFLTAFIMEKAGKFKKPLFLILMTIIFLSAESYLAPAVFFDKGEWFYTTNEATTTVQNEYMPRWVQEVSINKPKEKVFIVSGEGKIENFQTNFGRTSFVLKAKTNLEIEINTVYFPGWEVRVDNQKTIINSDNANGLIRFKVESGSHRAVVKFGETPIRLIADGITIISFITVIVLVIKTKKRR